MYSIGEVSKLLGVSTHTLRYYEKEHIILPDRNENGERIYREQHIGWLRFALKLKETQMPISKIKEYARLFTEGEQTSLARLELLEDHKRAIESQLETLIETNNLLEKKIKDYRDFIQKNKEAISG